MQTVTQIHFAMSHETRERDGYLSSRLCENLLKRLLKTRYLSLSKYLLNQRNTLTAEERLRFGFRNTFLLWKHVYLRGQNLIAVHVRGQQRFISRLRWTFNL